MRPLLIAIICLLTLPTFAKKNSFDLIRVTFQQKGTTIYEYQNGGDYYYVEFTKNEKDHNMTITKNKKAYFSIKSIKGINHLSIGEKGKMTALNRETYKIVPQEIQLLLAYIEQDEQVFDKPFNGGSNSSKLDLDGIPDKVGIGLNAAGGDSDSDCRQTAECYCEQQSVTVTCKCGFVISCEAVTAEVCDTDSNGFRTNCRVVTRCSGRCDAPYGGGN